MPLIALLATATDAAGHVSAASTALVVTVIPVTVDTIPPAPPVRETGGYNGDGNSDILWRHDSGQVYFWEIDGLQIQTEGGVAHAPVPTTGTSKPAATWMQTGTATSSGITTVGRSISGR
jgi:hypothetical protein